MTSNLVAGRTVRIATGPGAGDVFQYIGPTVTGTAASPIYLNSQDYRNTSLWKQLNLTSSPAEVSATTTRTSIDAGGSLFVEASSTTAIDAIRPGAVAPPSRSASSGSASAAPARRRPTSSTSRWRP